MRKALLALVAMLTLSVPSLTAGLPVQPEDGCTFGQAVLDETRTELQRLDIQIIKNEKDKAKLVVLVVQNKSLENLRASTLSWIKEHCKTA